MTLAIPVKVDFSPEGIRTMREARGLTAGEFAQVLGATYQTVWNWEAGCCKPGPYMRQRLREFESLLASV